MNCPFCKNKKLNRHLIFCKENKTNLTKIELRKLYLEYNYPKIALLDNLIMNYVNLKKSLSDIRSEFNIDYNSTKFLLNYYDIKIRNISEGIILSSDKRETTNLEKYGAKNVLSKGTEKYHKRNKTIKDKYGVDNIFQYKEVINKINDDNYYLEKYGVTLSEFRSLNGIKFWKSLSDDERKIFIDKCNTNRFITYNENWGVHPKKTEYIKEKYKKTCINKYGVESYFESKEFLTNVLIKEKSKETKIKNGYIISDFDIEPFKLYKRRCRTLTNKVKGILYEKWDGYDYYDGEFIKDYLKLNNTNVNYPTIDHKISIFYGFINDIPPTDISNISNLCITKRKINCSKRHKNYEDIS